MILKIRSLGELLTMTLNQGYLWYISVLYLFHMLSHYNLILFTAIFWVTVDTSNSLSWYNFGENRVKVGPNPNSRIGKNFFLMSLLQTWQWHMRPWGTCVLRMAKHLTLTFTVGAQGQSWSWGEKMPRNHIERNLHVRCFYSLIGLHLWYIQLSAHDFMRYTPVYLKSNNTCRSKNQDMKSKELSADFRNRIVSRHRSGKRYKKFL